MANEDSGKSPQSKGGLSRSASLTKDERSKIAQKAAVSRWGSAGKLSLKVAKYGANGKPLAIGGIEIPCYVLDDGTRVLVQRGIQLGIGMVASGPGNGTPRLIALMRSLLQKGIDIRGLVARLEEPIKFIPPHGGVAALGYEATILPDICAVIIDAQNAGKLKKTQQKLARSAAILQHAFATVGIIALVDEATGYQDHRERDALAKILEEFVQSELRPWIKTFPTEFYRQVHRLQGWKFDPTNTKHPPILGSITNEIVYARLAPGVLEELRRLTPRYPNGRLKNRLFQRLTDEIGHPKLREHLAGITMLMKYSPSWGEAIERIETNYPKIGDTLWFPFPPDLSAPN